MIDSGLLTAARLIARRFGFKSSLALARDLETIRRRTASRRQRMGATAKRESSARLNRARLGDKPDEAGITGLEIAALAVEGWIYGSPHPQALKLAAKRARARLNSRPNRREPDIHVDYALRALLMTFEKGTGQRATATGSDGTQQRASDAVDFIIAAWPLTIGTEPPRSSWLRQRIAPLLRDLHAEG
ncbi:MAG: hypothetical protein JNK71_05500 [Methyloversatilis sp.]|nr:hypothetical protein [Methyloversatilis sp.]